jgi:hypothetical protein
VENTDDASIALEVFSADWIDHAHPEVARPSSVQRAVEGARANQPDLGFHIEFIPATATWSLPFAAFVANRRPAAQRAGFCGSSA